MYVCVCVAAPVTNKDLYMPIIMQSCRLLPIKFSLCVDFNGSSLLLQQFEVFQFGGTRNEANVTAFFYQSTDPPVVVKFLYKNTHIIIIIIIIIINIIIISSFGSCLWVSTAPSRSYFGEEGPTFKLH